MSRANPRFRRVSANLPVLGATTTVQIALLGTIEGQIVMSTFAWQAPTAAPTPAQLSALVTAFDTAYRTKYLTCMSNDYTMSGYRLTVTSNNTTQGVNSNLGTGVVGTGGGGHQPTEIATTITRQSAIKGQHGRGRLGLPAVPLAAVINSTLAVGAYRTGLTSLTAQMLLTLSDGVNTWTPVITQRSTASPKLVIGASPVIGSTFDLVVGTIRRRKIGRGK